MIQAPFMSMIPQGDISIFEVASDSRGKSTIHTVHINGVTGEASCTCEAYTYTRKGGSCPTVWDTAKHCKHLRGIVRLLEIKEQV